MQFFICGSALRGQPDHGNLGEAAFVREAKTKPIYRLHSVRDEHPGIYEVAEGGVAIAGEIYELMCHPGEFDAQEVTDARLLRYHDWQGELSALTSPAARELLHRYRVRLIGYRHLAVRDDRLVVQHQTAQLLPSH